MQQNAIDRTKHFDILIHIDTLHLIVLPQKFKADA